jgi:Zn-dependent M28 family amino/carboxypeptidase
MLLLCPPTASADPLAREVIKTRLHRVEQDNAARRLALERMFREAGCTGSSLTRQNVPTAELPNVICTLPGATDRLIIISAHFDMRGPGLGVGDNWGSTSLLPSLYESLRATKPRHTFVFIGFTDEEKGLVGSRHYTAKLSDSDRERITAVVNMDGVGMSSTRVWATQADGELLRILNKVAKKERRPLGVVNLDGAGIMDSFSFSEKGIPSISLHGLAGGNFGIPHSRHDQLSAVSISHLHDTYLLLLSYLAALDEIPEQLEIIGGSPR